MKLRCLSNIYKEDTFYKREKTVPLTVGRIYDAAHTGGGFLVYCDDGEWRVIKDVSIFQPYEQNSGLV